MKRLYLTDFCPSTLLTAVFILTGLLVVSVSLCGETVVQKRDFHDIRINLRFVENLSLLLHINFLLILKSHLDLEQASK